MDESALQLARMNFSVGKRNLDSAEISARKALEIRKKILGDLHYQTALCHSQLGIILDYQNKGEEALIEFKKMLESSLKNFQSPHERIQKALNNVGNGYATLQKFKEAKTYYRKSLAMCRSLNGPLHLRNESTLNNLSYTSSLMLDYDSSIFFRKEIKKILDQNIGPYKITSLMNISKIGDDLIQQGNYDEAIMLFDTLVKKLSTFPPEEYKDISYQYGQLADCYLGKEEFERAEIFYRKGLAEANKNYGDKYIVTGVYHYGIGQCKSEMGEYQEALTQFKKALAIQRRELGLTDGNIGMIFSQIGNAFRDLNQVDSAILFLDSASKILINEPELQYKYEAGSSLIDLANLYEQKSDFNKSISLKKEGQRFVSESFKSKHYRKGTPFHSLAKTYWKMGQKVLALKNLWKALAENLWNEFDTLQGKPIRGRDCLDPGKTTLTFCFRLLNGSAQTKKLI
jgi:tetratricopeptide (TPR) repeat protein